MIDLWGTTLTGPTRGRGQAFWDTRRAYSNCLRRLRAASSQKPAFDPEGNQVVSFNTRITKGVCSLGRQQKLMFIATLAA